jgi:thioredoxin-like negative regulator of GroEL
MDEDAANAAAAAPLDPRTMPAQERREAKEWQTNTLGEDAGYRDAVMTWMGEVKGATREAREVARDDGREPEELRTMIGRIFTAWTNHGALMAIRKHLASALQRKNATIIADITLMNQRFEAAEAVWKSIPSQPARRDFPLAEALRDLVRSVDQAYHNQPVEHDAHQAGSATFDAFHAALKKYDAGK